MDDKLTEKLERWSDFFNPLLVREIRQSFRSNTFNGLIIISSLICAGAVICGILFSTSNRTDTFNMPVGLFIFNIIFLIVWCICCMALPVDASNRFRNERNKGEYELFLVTGIHPKKIVLGKLQSSIVQSLLVMVLTAPFLMICYLLRGISALEISMSLIAVFTFTILLTQIGILVGSFPFSKKMMAALYLPFGGILALCFFGVGIGIVSRQFEAFDIRTGDFLKACLFLILLASYYFYLSYLSSAAMLDTYSRNPSFDLRIFLLSSMLAILLFLEFGELFFGKIEKEAFLYVFLFPTALICSFLVPTVEKSANLPEQAPKTSKFMRILRIPFGSGKGNFYIWFGIYLLAISAYEVFFLKSTHAKSPLTITCTIFFLWSFIGNLVGKFFSKIPGLVCSLIAFIIPSLLAIFIAVSNDKNSDLALLLSPITTYSGACSLGFEWEFSAGAIFIQAILIIYGGYLYIHSIQTKKISNSECPSTN